jgi:ABC-type oligopeptide transport system substrate-binding subunit
MKIARAVVRSAFALALMLSVGGALAADMTKVLRVAYNAPENGFDPQASNDLYSNYVNREIFDAPVQGGCEYGDGAAANLRRWPHLDD